MTESDTSMMTCSRFSMKEERKRRAVSMRKKGEMDVPVIQVKTEENGFFY